MNRHIKHWFRSFSKDYPFCENCMKLPSYMETDDDGGEPFPEGSKNIMHLTDIELPYICDDSIMQCPKCKFYYFYRSFAPGGSEDAFRTVNYETISKTGLLGVYMELLEGMEFSSKEYQKYDKKNILYSLYLESYQKLIISAQVHLDYINKNALTLIKDAIVCLKLNASSKDNKYYKVDLIPAEEYAMEIVFQFLEKIDNPEIFLGDLKILENHPNDKIGNVIKKYFNSKNS